MSHFPPAHGRIALLGATGYIGRSLAHALLEKKIDVALFSRDPEKGEKTLASYGINALLRGYADLENEEFGVIINATGIGSPSTLKENPQKVFSATESMDDLLFSYLEKHPNTRVFNLSSGAIHNEEAAKILRGGAFEVSGLSPRECYAVAKLASEVRHRSHREYAIVDLRVFAFVSRWLDLDESFFFIAEVAKHLIEGTTLNTLPTDMVRDYSTAEDIWSVIGFLLTKPPMNNAFEMESLEPVSKFQLLKHFSEKFGLKYTVSDGAVEKSPTGEKNAYYSQSRTLASIGYTSEHTALENIDREIAALLLNKGYTSIMHSARSM